MADAAMRRQPLCLGIHAEPRSTDSSNDRRAGPDTRPFQCRDSSHISTARPYKRPCRHLRGGVRSFYPFDLSSIRVKTGVRNPRGPQMPHDGNETFAEAEFRRMLHVFLEQAVVIGNPVEGPKAAIGFGKPCRSAPPRNRQ